MEQALVFASIVLGIAVAFELQHLNTLLRSKRVKWHWAQPLFALFVLMSIMSIWWMIAGRPIEGPMTLGRFLPIMWVLVILNLLAAVALPDRVPDEGIDLADYYQSNCRYMWGLYILFFLPLAINWFNVARTMASSVDQFMLYVWGDMLALSMIIFLFFVRRWWLVAIGYVGLALMATNWLSRTI